MSVLDVPIGLFLTTVQPVDPFEQVVFDAKERLSRREGSEVSWREIARRAGYEHRLGGFMYHLRSKPGQRARGRHSVPTWVVDAVEKVLPVTRTELDAAAAAAASGFSLTITRLDELPGPDAVVSQVTRVLNDESIDEAERERIGLEVMEAITRSMQNRRRDAGTGA